MGRRLMGMMMAGTGKGAGGWRVQYFLKHRYLPLWLMGAYIY